MHGDGGHGASAPVLRRRVAGVHAASTSARARGSALPSAKTAGVRVNGIPAALRRSLYAVAAGLWLSGCGWLVLQWNFQTPTEFGAQPHPWQPSLMLVHGLLAVPALYLFGWVSARHALDGWRMARRRASGGVLFVVLAVLALSGFGLYYATGDLTRGAIALVHEILGVACLIPVLAHWPAPATRGDRQGP